MYMHRKKFRSHIISLRTLVVWGAYCLSASFLLTSLSTIPLPDISSAYSKSFIHAVIPATKTVQKTELHFTPYDFLANTVLSIKSSEIMSKKYAARYGGVKKTETINESVQQELSASICEEDLSAGGISFINTPGFSVDANELLSAPLSFVSKNSEPRVLIVHTHTSEAYQNSPFARSENATQNVVSVGREIARTLENAGVRVIHDTTQNDSPSYNQSYKKTMAVINENLSRNQTLEVVLDIHRDYIERDDGTLSKPTVTINGKKAAQIMFVIGTDDMGLEHPNWRHNLSFAVKIQNELNKRVPGLCRSINIRTERFNQHMTKGSMIIEVGTGANTLEEAKYSGRLIGEAIGKILQNN